MIEAHNDCMRHKRSKTSAMLFDANREELLYSLWQELSNHTYSISPSNAFVVTHPKPREVFAADFRDRIVHHWIALRIEPILMQMLIPNTFSCIKGRGTLAMQKAVSNAIQANNGLYICKIDIEGFFNSISRMRLWQKMESLIMQYYQGGDKDDLL
mgnify:CR=1 FL=1